MKIISQRIPSKFIIQIRLGIQLKNVVSMLQAFFNRVEKW